MSLVLCFVLFILVLLSCSKDRPPTAPVGKANCLICGSLDLPHEVNPNVDTAQDTTSTDEAVAVADSLTLLPDSLAFNIELIFLDEFDPMEKEIMLEEVKHWEKMLGDIPDYYIGQDGTITDCGEHKNLKLKDRTIDDILIYVAKLEQDKIDRLGG